MKTTFLVLFLFLSFSAFSQQKGTVYGSKPDQTGVIAASKVENSMDKKTRMNMAIRGRILKVTKPNGGWFDIDAGNGRIISAHFKKAGINIPSSLAGKTVVVDGVVQKQFIADDKQHFAGDTVVGKKQSQVKTNPKQKLIFEVTGMMVE
jgi:hypothetical protein